MSPLAQALVQYVVPALSAALLPFLAKALLALSGLLQAKKAQGVGWNALAALESIVANTVAHAEVELRPQFQKAMEDGRLTPEEGVQLKAAVVSLVLKTAPAEVLAAAQQVLGGALDAWLSGQVERANALLPDLSVRRIPSSALPTPPIRGQVPALVPAPGPTTPLGG